MMLMPLPQPGTSGTPYFTGKNVSEFLKAWENLCEDYGVSSADQLRKLPRYCARLIGRYIETIPECQAKDWGGLKTGLASRVSTRRCRPTNGKIELPGSIQESETKP
jgi:hypothetical protein